MPLILMAPYQSRVKPRRVRGRLGVPTPLSLLGSSQGCKWWVSHAPDTALAIDGPLRLLWPPAASVLREHRPRDTLHSLGLISLDSVTINYHFGRETGCSPASDPTLWYNAHFGGLGWRRRPSAAWGRLDSGLRGPFLGSCRLVRHQTLSSFLVRLWLPRFFLILSDRHFLSSIPGLTGLWGKGKLPGCMCVPLAKCCHLLSPNTQGCFLCL